MIWDQGTWEPEVDDVDAGMGRANSSSVSTVRNCAAPGRWCECEPAQWLLIKHRDEAASTLEIVGAKPRSAVSRRTLAGIARRAGATPRQLKQAAEADQVLAQS